MKKRIKQQQELFWKFLFSYILILIFPLAMVFSFLNGKVFHILEEQLFEEQVGTINRLQELIDLNLQQLVSIHTEMTLNKEINDLESMQDVLKVQQLVQTLKRYVIATPWLHDIILYYPEDKYLYTSTSTSTVERFFDKLMQFESPEYTYILQEYLLHPPQDDVQMQMIPAQQVRYSGKQKELLPICMPLKPDYKTQSASVVYLVDVQVLKDWVLAPTNSNAEEYLVLDSKGDTIARLGPGSNLQQSQFDINYKNKWIQRGQMEYRIISVDSEKYMLCRTESKNNSFMYLSASSMKEIYRSVDGLKGQLLLISVLIGILGIGIVAYNMKKNYGPIQQLSHYAKTLFPGQDTRNEIQAIQSSMTHISDQYIQLKESSSVPFQNHFLQRLLQGEYNDCSHLDALGEVGDVHFEQDSFVVFILRFAKKSQLVINEQILQQICQKIISGYLQRSNDRNSYLYIGNFDSNSQEQLPEKIELLYQTLKQELDCQKLVIAVGDCCNEMSQISHSYETAVLAADYRFVQGHNCIIWHKDLSFDSFMVEAYPKQLFEQLRYALQRGETENLYPALNEIIRYLKTGNMPLFYVRSLSYELINILSETLVKLGNEKFSNEFLKTYSSFLSDFDTIDELADALSKLCVNICLYIVEGILQEKDEKLYKIKYDIETGYSDPNFSIQGLAERQGMTSAALSQYFKSQTGTTVMDYLTEKRMEKAKELLREGDLTLNEITQKIGYINTSSFIRRFKGLYGLTPRQYVATYPDKQQDNNQKEKQ